MKFRFAALLLAPLALWPALVSAADLGSVRTMRPVAGASDPFVITVTANGQVQPVFPGSDKLMVVGYPSFNIRRASEPPRFAAPDDGFSISLYEEIPELRFGPVARVQGGRYLRDDRRLFGLRRIDWSIEPGFFVEYFPVSFIRARVELRYALNGAEGFVGNAGLDFIAPIDRWTLSVGPRIGFADANYVRTYFGVRPFEAALNGRVGPYRPGADVTSAGVLGAATYKWNETWATTAYVGYNRLIGDAGRSPIVRVFGSRDQLLFGASVSYSFNWTP
jgi:outer membrane scaffolding protein for murein synthesis (MipA/OmpV family)